MKWFKSIWLKMRKSNGLPGPQVMIPLETKSEPEPQPQPEVVKKPRKPRKKKDETKEI